MIATLRASWLTLFFSGLAGSLLSVPHPAMACVVGDSSKMPVIMISSYPTTSCTGGMLAGVISGTVTNVDTARTAVFLYALTDYYYTQPSTLSERTEIHCDGTFSNETYCGSRYVALVALRSWNPPDKTSCLPTVDGDTVFALASAPDEVRTITFAGRGWTVRTTGADRADPGANVWSDLPANVYVDAMGLHLALTHEGEVWHCPEVCSVEPLTVYSVVQFEVASAVDALDQHLVLGLFVYDDSGGEFDVEIAGNDLIPGAYNAQFVGQDDPLPPDCLHVFTMSGSPTSYTCTWLADRIDFIARHGTLDNPGDVIAAWTLTDTQCIPRPGRTRLHLNFWLTDNQGPSDGLDHGVVISNVRVGNSAAIRPTTWGAIKARYR
jgi:hypothetical protein